MRSLLLIAPLLLLAAPPASAQDRTVEMRHTLVGLTRVLGESHALRQACEGPDDMYWRSRMTRLVETEQPDPEFERQLKDSFNAGFAEMRRLYRSCDDGARRAQEMTAVRGRELSSTLAHAKHRTGVMPVMPEEEGVTAEPAPR
jgi:uncharacterized protein (TIGR02301 family)